MVSSCPYGKLRPFRISRIDLLPRDARGVYGFWYRRRCVYVGKAVEQPIGTRLMQHWKGSHNPELTLWLEAEGREITFAACLAQEGEDIDKLESYYIRKFQPVTNKTLKKKERRS